jgi:hypothetical protein
MDPGAHLSEIELSGLLDHALAGEDRVRAEQHLEGCAECRAEWLAVARLADSYEAKDRSTAPRPTLRRPARRWLPLAVGGALAAGLAALLLFRPDLVTRVQPREPLRAPDFSEGRTRLEIVSPSPDSSVSRPGLSLIWHGSAASLYRVIVLTESGEPVWTADTPDTTVALPDGVTLLPGRLYFWRVEGIANGITASTGANRLRVRP